MSDLIVEPTQEPLVLATDDSDVFLIAEATGSVIIAPESDAVVLVEQPPAPPFLHVHEDVPEVLIATEPGPRGSDGYIPPIGPVFTYAGGLLIGVVYDDGSTKTLTYDAGVLEQVVFVRAGVTSTKTFNYAGGVLQSIDEVIG